MGTNGPEGADCCGWHSNGLYRKSSTPHSFQRITLLIFLSLSSIRPTQLLLNYSFGIIICGRVF
jgi:hypothetical protein